MHDAALGICIGFNPDDPKQKYSRLKANVSQENLKTILNCFALEHSAFETKHLKMS